MPETSTAEGLTFFIPAYFGAEPCTASKIAQLSPILAPGLVGGLGFAPGANIGDNCAIFEAVHGSAPKYAGMKKVNPSAVLVSGIMMLRWIKEEAAADRIQKAMFAVLDERKHVTYDVGGTATTDEYAQAIVDKMHAKA